MLYLSIIVIVQTDDSDEESDKDDLSGEPVVSQGEPPGSVNGKSETEDKENKNGTSTDDTQAVRYESDTSYLKSYILLL